MGFLTLEAKPHPALWGSESWEISAHPSDPSRVDLNALFPSFPLLFKVIDAKTRLSVQVHLNEETCKVTGGEPKTEMWCALSDGPIYAGLREGTTAADVESAGEAASLAIDGGRAVQDVLPARGSAHAGAK